MHTKLFSLISSIQPPSVDLSEALHLCIHEEALPKRSVILKEGETCNRMFFIEKGFVRAFYYKQEQEVTSWFMQEDEFIISVYSFFNQKPSKENIELLEDSVLISIKFSDLQQIYKKFPEFNYVGRVLTERYYCLSEERLITMRMQSTREKYDMMMQTYPEIFNRAPLKYIASYLGMKPETISRLRASK